MKMRSILFAVVFCSFVGSVSQAGFCLAHSCQDEIEKYIETSFKAVKYGCDITALVESGYDDANKDAFIKIYKSDMTQKTLSVGTLCENDKKQNMYTALTLAGRKTTKDQQLKFREACEKNGSLGGEQAELYAAFKKSWSSSEVKEKSTGQSGTNN